MGRELKFFCLLVLSLTLGACEKVIDLKFKNIEPKYVIEGLIANENASCKVIISSTKDFKDDNDFAGISGAVITMETKGVVYKLLETATGTYQNNTLKGVPGQTYNLKVVINQEVITSTCTMPLMVPFDAIYVSAGDVTLERAMVNVRYRDTPDVKNYYWFQQYVNGSRMTDYAVVSDELSSGRDIVAGLIFKNNTSDASRNFKSGDRLTVVMHSIDLPVYNYLNSLSSASGMSYDTAPSNPRSNLNGSALGYFSAHTTQRRSIILP